MEDSNSPSHLSFFPKLSDQNFEITILFSIVERSNNYVFEDDLTPPFPKEEGLQVINFAHRLHIVLTIGKRKESFEGGSDGILMWEDLSMEDFLWG